MPIKIKGEIGWEVTARDVEYALSRESGDITVEIDSPGGAVFEGVRIHNALANYEGKVTVVIGALAASIATYIAMAGDEIKAHDNSTFMIHNAWGFAMGDHRVMRDTAEVLEGLTSLIARKYQERTGMSDAEVRALMDKETFFFGEEIAQAGFADDVIATGKDDDKQAALALVKERYKACLKHMKEKEEEVRKEEVAALLRDMGDGDKVAKAKLRLAQAKLKLFERGI